MNPCATRCPLPLPGKYDGIPAGIVDKYPRVKALYDRVAAHPKVAEWNTAHP